MLGSSSAREPGLQGAELEASFVPSNECSFLINEVFLHFPLQTILLVVLRAFYYQEPYLHPVCDLMAAPESVQFKRLGLGLISIPPSLSLWSHTSQGLIMANFLAS